MNPAISKLAKQIKFRVNLEPRIYGKTPSPSRIGLNRCNSLFGIKDITINANGTYQLLNKQNSSLLNKLIYNVNRYGVCLININNFDNKVPNHRDFLKKNIYDLKPLFGQTAFHQKSDPNTGILTIDPRKPNSVNVANTDIPHPPHTDGAFQTFPEKIVTVAAENVALEPDGGLTTLICGQSMLNYVFSQINGSPVYQKQIIDALFDKDALEIGRKLPQNDGNEPVFQEIVNKQAILSYLYEYDNDNNDNNDNLRLIYRYGNSYLKNIRNKVKKVWNLMNKYCENEQNIFKFKLLPGQILIIDNTAYLHGRTAYNKNNLRVLHRLNFFNNGLLRRSIKLGINKNILSV